MVKHLCPTYCKILKVHSTIFLMLYINELHNRSYRNAPPSTAENVVISPTFLVRTFCGKTQLSHSFG